MESVKISVFQSTDLLSLKNKKIQKAVNELTLKNR